MYWIFFWFCFWSWSDFSMMPLSPSKSIGLWMEVISDTKLKLFIRNSFFSLTKATVICNRVFHYDRCYRRFCRSCNAFYLFSLVTLAEMMPLVCWFLASISCAKISLRFGAYFIFFFCCIIFRSFMASMSLISLCLLSIIILMFFLTSSLSNFSCWFYLQAYKMYFSISSNIISFWSILFWICWIMKFISFVNFLVWTLYTFVVDSSKLISLRICKVVFVS